MDENMINNLMNMFKNQQNSSNSTGQTENPSISPEAINNIMNMIKNNNKDNSSESTSNSANNIDIETIMKLKTVLEKVNSRDDPRSNLLLSLKPYLKESRKNKVEQYIQLFNMTKVLDIFNSMSGGESKK